MHDLDRAPDDVASLVDVETPSLTDHVAILQLLNLYSHLVDDFEVEAWSQLFTRDARFEIRFARGGSGQASVLEGRDAIRDLIFARQATFRAANMQRRHYLTNPVIFEHASASARVMTYLQLANIHPERGLEIEGTGRYDGVVSKTAAGWRIALWRLTADGTGERLSAPPASD